MSNFADWFETEILPTIANLGEPEINLMRAVAELTWDERERHRIAELDQVARQTAAALARTIMEAIN